MALEKTELFAFQFKIKPLHLVDDVLMAMVSAKIFAFQFIIGPLNVN